MDDFLRASGIFGMVNFIQELAGTPKLLILAILGGSGNHEVLVARHTMGVTLW